MLASCTPWPWNITAHAALTRRCSGCIIQVATCLLIIREKHISLDSSSAAGREETAAKMKHKSIHLLSHIQQGSYAHTHTLMQHVCSSWWPMHTSATRPTRPKSSLKNKWSYWALHSPFSARLVQILNARWPSALRRRYKYDGSLQQISNTENYIKPNGQQHDKNILPATVLKNVKQLQQCYSHFKWKHHC